MDTPLKEMTKLKDWAQERLREGGEPPWSLYCMIQLIEAVDLLSSGAEAGFFDIFRTGSNRRPGGGTIMREANGRRNGRSREMEHSIDIRAGRRVRQRRWMLGMPRQQLGDEIGVTIAQIQKYETGTDRISARRMWDIAAALKVPASFFLEGLDGQAPDTGAARGYILTDEEAHELVRAYDAIPENRRRRLSDLADLAGVLGDGGLSGGKFFNTGEVHRAEHEVAS